MKVEELQSLREHVVTKPHVEPALVQADGQLEPLFADEGIVLSGREQRTVEHCEGWSS